MEPAAQTDPEVLPGDAFPDSDSETDQTVVFVVLSNGKLFGVYRSECDAQERTRELSRPVILQTVLDADYDVEYFDGREADSPAPPSTPPGRDTQGSKRTDWWMVSYGQ